MTRVASAYPIATEAAHDRFLDSLRDTMGTIPWVLHRTQQEIHFLRNMEIYTPARGSVQANKAKRRELVLIRHPILLRFRRPRADFRHELGAAQLEQAFLLPDLASSEPESTRPNPAYRNMPSSRYSRPTAPIPFRILTRLRLVPSPRERREACL